MTNQPRDEDRIERFIEEFSPAHCDATNADPEFRRGMQAAIDGVKPTGPVSASFRRGYNIGVRDEDEIPESQVADED